MLNLNIFLTFFSDAAAEEQKSSYAGTGAGARRRHSGGARAEAARGRPAMAAEREEVREEARVWNGTKGCNCLHESKQQKVEVFFFFSRRCIRTSRPVCPRVAGPMQ